MGLGKTIQSMSLILMNPRPTNAELEKDKKNKIPVESSKTTLVVAPLALIRQWESEIKTKSGALKVLVHHGPSRTKSARNLIKADVVVTTYQTLTSEHAASSDNDDGPKIGCFGAHWYRIILDEAHSIKNRNAKSTKACYALKSVYRWCLTGTPMQNNLDELQSLIRFLCIKPYCDLATWKQQISDPMKNGRGGLAMRRLQYFLKACMKRRTKDVLKKEGAFNAGGQEHAEGFKIVDRNVQIITAEFGHHERKFYDRLESRTKASLEEMMSGETQDYFGALVLLLRMRQACNHPHLMKAKMEKDKDALTTAYTGDPQAPRKEKVDDKEVDAIADLLGGMSVHAKKCNVCQTKLSREESQNGRVRCAECEEIIDEEEKAERSVYRTQKKKKSKSKSKSKSTNEHRSERRKLQAARRKVIVDSDDEEEAEWIVPKGQRAGSDLGVHTDDEEAEGGGEWIKNDDPATDDEDEDESASEESSEEEYEEEEGSTATGFRKPSAFASKLVSSTKIDRLLDILEKETPEHKVIVFSQFTTMLDLIEPFLVEDGYKFVRYDGSMRNDAREASLNKLRSDKRTRVLLCSLKCGSLGLNLTAASRVVLMEPFWNPVCLWAPNIDDDLLTCRYSLSKNKPLTASTGSTRQETSQFTASPSPTQSRSASLRCKKPSAPSRPLHSKAARPSPNST
jgi:SNF2 family DNA or RNA helicase